MLVTDAGEEVLRAGDCAGFKAGEADGHQLQNRSDAEVVCWRSARRNPEGDGVDYPGHRSQIRAGVRTFLHKDGTPYPPRSR